MDISPVNSIGKLISASKLDNFGGENGADTKISGIDGFKQVLAQTMQEASALGDESTKLGQDFTVGKTNNLHQVMIAGEKADIALQLTMQIRNKILDAYNEIMRMQV